jgi:WD40 repeat protein
VWDVATGGLVFQTRPQVGAILTVAFSPDGRYLGTPNRAGFAQVWDTRAGGIVSAFTDHTGEVLGLVYGPGGMVATSGTDGTARLWDAGTGKQVLALRGHSGPVNDVAFFHDGTRLVSADEDGTVRVWDITPGGGRDWLTIDADRGGVDSVMYNPKGTQLLSSGISDGKVKLWDARTGRLLAAYQNVVDGGVAYIAGSGFPPQVSVNSPDERYGVDLHESGGKAVLRSSDDGDVLARVGHQPRSAAFDPQSRLLAVGGGDGTVVIWDIRERRVVRSFAAHKGEVDAIDFNPDGSELATAGEDTTAKLWDLRTGRNVLTLGGHTRYIDALDFSPDGTRLATGSRDGTVRVYVLPVGELMAVARSRVTRGLTPQECAQYLGGGC